MEDMIIEKISCPELYQFLERAFNLFSKADNPESNKFFIDKDKENFIADASGVALEFNLKGQEIRAISNDYELFELSKVPGKKFKLEAKEKGTDNEFMQHLDVLEYKISKQNKHYVCELQVNENAIASKLTRYSKLYVRDSLIKIIEKVGNCIVKKKDDYLTFTSIIANKNGDVFTYEVNIHGKTFVDVDQIDELKSKNQHI